MKLKAQYNIHEPLFTLLLAFLLFLANSAAVQAEEFRPPSYDIMRAQGPINVDGNFQELEWFAAPSLGDFHFPWFLAGTREQSIVKLLWNDDYLFIACICQDAHITARHSEHDGAIPTDDCIEIMLAPRANHPECYFNIEWNLLGGYIDGHRPLGASGPRTPWDVTGIKIAGNAQGTPNSDSDTDTSWTVEVAIPWSNFREHLANFPPLAGDVLRANFNRHGGDMNMQYSQWSPADTPSPAFHVPHRFGTLVLSSRIVPFSTAP
jgi:Carbohydrate-binding family 9